MARLDTSSLRDRTYLGDGVYAGHDGFQIVLWVSDGISVTDTIAVEDSVVSALLAYRDRLRERVGEA